MVGRNPLEPTVFPPDGNRDKEPALNLRLVAIQLLILLIFGVLLVQLWRLQVVEGHSFRQLADINRLRESPVEAPRGIIYDRNHNILAANKPSFDVALVPAALPKDNPGDVYSQLSKMIGLSAGEIAETVKQRQGDDFSPVTVKRDVDRDTVMRIEEQHLKLPGAVVVPESSRLYPFGSLTSHILGYMLPITGEQLTARKASDKDAGYRAEDRIGTAGIESTYERELRGKPGRKQYEVDATERPISDLRIDSPDSGHNLTLSLDIDLQKDVAKILQAGMGQSLFAVAIVMNPKNGQVLAMVSVPAYDNNLFAGVVKGSDLQSLMDDPRKPMIDYSIGGTFPPGSTFKLVTASGALQEKVANENTEINCPGYLLVPNQYNPSLSQRLPCWGVHGKETFVTGLSNSCDTYFYTLGGGTPTFDGLGNQRLASYAKMLGYGAPTGIDLPGELAGLIPSDKWKQDNWGEAWLKGDTYNMSIGQGFVLSTPLQVANATNAIANGGRLLKPRIVAGISDAEDQPIRAVEPEVIRKLDVDQHNLDLIRQGMRGVMFNDDVKGVNIPELKIAGKTGTAEYPGEKDDKGIMPTHGWFTAFAPYDDPQISVTVFVQRGGGPSNAVPIAMEIFKRYFHYTAPPASPTPVYRAPTPAPARTPAPVVATSTATPAPADTTGEQPGSGATATRQPATATSEAPSVATSAPAPAATATAPPRPANTATAPAATPAPPASAPAPTAPQPSPRPAQATAAPTAGSR